MYKNLFALAIVVGIILAVNLYADVLLDITVDAIDLVEDKFLPFVDKSALEYLHWRGKGMTEQEAREDAK